MAEAKAFGKTDEMVGRAQAEARALRLGDGARLACFDVLDAGCVAVFDVPDVRSLRYSALDYGADSSATYIEGSESTCSICRSPRCSTRLECWMS